MPLTLGIAVSIKMIQLSLGTIQGIKMILRNHGTVTVQHGKNIKLIRRG